MPHTKRPYVVLAKSSTPGVPHPPRIAHRCATLTEAEIYARVLVFNYRTINHTDVQTAIVPASRVRRKNREHEGWWYNP